MRPTVIPDDMVGDGMRRMVIGPPGGDLESEIAPVEVLFDGKIVGVLLTLEDGDLEKLRENPRLWLLWHGDHLHPFSLELDSEMRR